MTSGRQRVDIPHDLKEADEVMSQFGRWAQDRYRKQTCASAEKNYRSPDNWGDDGPPAPFIPDFKAMEVHRALQRVPVFWRRILFAQYIPQRIPAEAQRRKMGIAGSVWDQERVTGLRMFWNIWRKGKGAGLRNGQICRSMVHDSHCEKFLGAIWRPKLALKKPNYQGPDS